jgi:superoxide dismutase
VQLKLKPAPRFEINAAFGQDENFAEDLRFFSTPFTGSGFFALKKNHTDLVNLIYTPNSSLIFAVEYRHLFTAPALGQSASGDHLNLAAGVRF